MIKRLSTMVWSRSRAKTPTIANTIAQASSDRSPMNFLMGFQLYPIDSIQNLACYPLIDYEEQDVRRPRTRACAMRSSVNPGRNASACRPEVVQDPSSTEGVSGPSAWHDNTPLLVELLVLRTDRDSGARAQASSKGLDRFRRLEFTWIVGRLRRAIELPLPAAEGKDSFFRTRPNPRDPLIQRPCGFCLVGETH